MASHKATQMGALGVPPSSEKSSEPRSTPSLPMVPAGLPTVDRCDVAKDVLAAFFLGTTFLATFLGFFAAIISMAGEAARGTLTLMGEEGATKPLTAVASAITSRAR